MRDKEELDSIALTWAEETINFWNNEFEAWDGYFEDFELTDEEWEYCRSRNFKIEIVD